MQTVPKKRPVMLAILDGWGWREGGADNAVSLARTPNFDALWDGCPRAFLRTSGLDVGLPEGQMGNSEVGHLNIGAGRVVMQDLPRIGAAIADGSLAAMAPLRDFVARLRASGGVAHLVGLVSPGGVHAHQDHAVALARVLVAEGIAVRIQGFTDGGTRRRVRRRASWPLSRRRCPRAHLASLLRPPTGRWTATTAGIAWSAPGAPWCWPRAPPSPTRRPPSPRPMRPGDGRVPRPRHPARTCGMQDGDGPALLQLPRRPRAQILAALVEPGFSGFARPRRPDFAAASAWSSIRAS
jgi:2,3-bisphosphoglycerate-independent phosphoglycerate mutase